MDNTSLNSEPYQLDPIQKALLQKKFNILFWRITNIYNKPNATKDLVNNGVAVKLAHEFCPEKGYHQVEQNKIAEHLSEVDFTEFFTDTKSSDNKDRRVYFLLRNPKGFLTSKVSNKAAFIRYVFKKYCNITSSERLLAIFNKQFLLSKLTNTQFELLQAIYSTVKQRSSFTQKFLNLFADSLTKNEIKAANSLRKLIEERKYKTVSSNPSLASEEYPELFMIHSVAAATQKEDFFQKAPTNKED